MPEPGYTKRRVVWTAEEMIAKVHEWADLYGDVPSAADWNASDLRAAVDRSTERAAMWLTRLDRLNRGEWPWTGSVYKKFGGWNELVEAAGEVPRPAHGGQPNIRIEYAPAKLNAITRRVAAAEGDDERKAALRELAFTAWAMADELDAEA